MNNLRIKADKYLQQGDFTRAKVIYEKILKKNKSDPELASILGYICGQLNELNEAIIYLKKSASLQPANAHAYYNLGFAYQSQQQWSKAVTAYQQVLNIKPDFTEASHNLAAVMQFAGMLDESQQLYEELLKKQPESESLLLASASVFIDLNDYISAIKLAEKVLDKNKHSAKAYTVVGMAEYLENNHSAARKAFSSALEIDSTLFDASLGLAELYYAEDELQQAIHFYKLAMTNKETNEQPFIKLGLIYKNLGKPELSIEYYKQGLERAKSLNKDDSFALLGLAEVYEMSGDWEEAKVTYRKLKQGSYKNRAAAGLAHILERQNKSEEALKLIKPLLKEQPLLSSVVLTYASICQEQNNHNAAIDLCEKALKENEMTLDVTSQIQYKLGGLLDAIGEFEKAFKYYSLANETGKKLNTVIYNNDKQGQYVDWCIDKFTSKTLPLLPHSSNLSHAPVFIIGMPRSGTSLVEQILAGHPDVYGAGELPDIYDYINAFQHNMGDIKNEPLADSLNDITTDLVEKLSSQYLEKIKKLSSNSPIVIDKHPGNYRYIGLISLLFPQARIIHCVRNPADTCLSIYFQDFTASQHYSTDLKALGEYYQQYQRLMQYWQSTLSESILTVQYEDVVQNIEAESKKMLEFIGLPWNEACLSFHKNKRKVNTPSYQQVRKPIYNSSVERWRNYQPHISELLEALG